MSLSVTDITRVLLACQERVEDKPLISFVFPHHGVSCQVFLDWRQGRMLKEYVLSPSLNGYLSLHTAYHSRIVDQRGLRHRLTYMPKPNDELRFLTVRAGVV